MPKWRKIVVDGSTYEYHVGRSYVVFDNGHRVKLNEITGRDWDTIERGQWKKTSDGMVTPKHIAEYLRKRYGTSARQGSTG